MRSLFVITSPLQYVNACEAIDHFSVQSEDVYFAFVPSRRHPESIVQVQRLAERNRWAGARVLEGLPAMGLVERPRLIRDMQIAQGARLFRRQADEYLAHIGNLDAIFLGDWRARSFRYFPYRCPQARVFLLDDGSITSQAVRFRNDPRDPLIEARAFPTSEKADWKVDSQVPFFEPERITFFTSYVLPPLRRDDVVTHSFGRLSREILDWKPVEEVWFVGSNHVENGITRLADYFRHLRRVRRFFGDSRVKYCAHRGEDRFKLRQIGRLGFDVVSSELPLEVVMQEGRSYPTVIAAIASSVVDNVSAIFGARVNVLLFVPGKGYVRGKQKHLRDIVRYHRRGYAGNTHVIDAGSAGRASFEQYNQLLDAVGIVTAYGVEGAISGALSLSGRQSGSSFRRTAMKNTQLEYELDVQVERSLPACSELGKGLRTEPTLRCVPCPLPDGREFWLLLEGASENRYGFRGKEMRHGLRGEACSIRPLSMSQNVVSPSGERDAVHVVEDHTYDFHRVKFPPVDVPASVTIAVSVFAKRAGRDFVRLRMSRGETFVDAYFNLADGTVGVREASAGAEALRPTIKSVGEQWYRISIRGRLDGDGRIGSQLLLRQSGSGQFSSYQGDGYSGVYLFGPQLSIGETVPSYLPAVGGRPAARKSDMLNLEVRERSSPVQDRLLALKFLNPTQTSTETPVVAMVADGEVLVAFSFTKTGFVVRGTLLAEEETFKSLRYKRVRRLFLRISKSDSSLHFGINGQLFVVQLKVPLQCDRCQFRLGADREDYYRFVCEYVRISAASPSDDDLAELSRVSN